MHYYEHNIGDFAIETKGMSYEAIGVYMTLIDRYAATQSPITEAWVSIAFSGESKCLANALLDALFVKTDGGFVHPRIETLIKAYEDKSKKRAEAGRKGGLSRQKQSNESKCQANAKQVVSQPITNNQEPINTEELPIGSSRGNSCADAPEFPHEDEAEPQLNGVEKPLKQQNCPTKEIVDSYNEILGPWLGRVREVTPSRRTAIRARWLDVIRVCGVSDRETSIVATRAYFEKIARSNFLMGRVEGAGRKWKADFDWILKSDSFTKIYEGKYDNQR